MFSSMTSLALPKPANLHSELVRYLTADVEHITDPIMWWYKCYISYPHLNHMALDHLSILGRLFVLQQHVYN